MKAKWKMEMVDIVRIRKGEWTRFLAVFPISALQELNSLDESTNISTSALVAIDELVFSQFEMMKTFNDDNS